jgi:hypothetical protein
VLVLYGLLATARPAQAEILRYVDGQGRIHLFYRPKVERAPRAGGTSKGAMAREQQLMPTIEKIAYEHDLDPLLVRAVMHVESGFRSEAVSRAGAKGLMQLMPATAASYGVEDIFDIEQNIRGGVRFLKHLKSRYGEDLRLLLAAYNAGETVVERAGGVPEIAETQQYIVDVLHQYQRRGGEAVAVVVSESRASQASEPKKASKPPARRRAPEMPATPSRPIQVRLDGSGNVVISNVP